MGRRCNVLLYCLMGLVGASFAPQAAAAPHLEVTRGSTELTFPDGCFFAEEVHAAFEICNAGDEEAVGFRPGVRMGPGLAVNLGFDPLAASSPQACFGEDSPNHQPCASPSAVCVEGFCEEPCRGDGECGSAQRCVEARCRYHLAPSECASFEMSGVLPQVNGNVVPFEDSEQRFFFLGDSADNLGDEAPDVFRTPAQECRIGLPDFQPITAELQTGWVAGEPRAVTTQVRNLGFIQIPSPGAQRPERVEIEVRYVLASSPDVSLSQIPLEGGGLFSLGRKSDTVRTVHLWTPAETLPGTYYLGILVDPEGVVPELSESNNIYVHPEPIRLEAPALRIVTDSLPPFVVGSKPQFSLFARGGVGAYRWSASDLPAGMSLDAGGRLEGRPTEIGRSVATVRVEAGGATAERLFIVDVVAPAGSLEVTTARLPVAVQGQRYEDVRLTAQGGVPPYRWSLGRAGTSPLPAGLEGPSEEGIISGSPRAFARSAEIQVVVEDSRGTRATRELVVQVKSGADLRIQTRSFADGTMGVPYAGSCARAAGVVGDGALRWGLERRQLPRGLEAIEEGARLCLVGTPERCGSYLLAVSVEDGAGQRDEAEISLEIRCEELRLEEQRFSGLVPGEEVELRLRSVPEADARFELVLGALPPGLGLSGDGVIEGTLAAGAASGAYDLVVELRDEVGRRGVSPLTLRVEAIAEELPPAKKREDGGGCGSAGGGGPFWSLFVALAFASSRRRPGQRSVARASRSGGARVEREPRPGARRGLRALLGLGFFAVALFFSVSACGSEEAATPAELRCAEACEDGMSCDLSEGICKCGGAGGIVCGAGERCELEPGPRCEPSACDESSCERGESCDPLTGSCSCGGASCGEGERCVEGVCTLASLCAGVRCPAGSECDPADGSCRCGEEICDEGEWCDGARCAADRCAGVNCGLFESCNREDGVCHCGGFAGQVCGVGEACASEGGSFGCITSSRCDGVVCKGGTICDPVDGQCRCGGIGSTAPVCGSDQSCVDGQCRGGLLCLPEGEPLLCRQDLSCDPDTGACACGGKGGVLCEDDERCVLSAAGPRCQKVCALADDRSGCGANEGCYFDPEAPAQAPFCYRAGPMSVGHPCESSIDCEPGLHCGNTKVCRMLCLLDARVGCGASTTTACLPIGAPGAEGVGYCVSR